LFFFFGHNRHIIHLASFGKSTSERQAQPVDSASFDCSAKSFAFFGNLRKLWTCVPTSRRRRNDVWAIWFNVVSRWSVRRDTTGAGEARNLWSASPKQFYLLYAPLAFRKGGRINFLEKIFAPTFAFNGVKMEKMVGLGSTTIGFCGKLGKIRKRLKIKRLAKRNERRSLLEIARSRKIYRDSSAS
jgi:hypothetical protein